MCHSNLEHIFCETVKHNEMWSTAGCDVSETNMNRRGQEETDPSMIDRNQFINNIRSKIKKVFLLDRNESPLWDISIMSQTALILASFFVMFIFLEEARLNEGSQKKRTAKEWCLAVRRVCYFERCFIVLLPQLIKWWFYNFERHWQHKGNIYQEIQRWWDP